MRAFQSIDLSAFLSARGAPPPLALARRRRVAAVHSVAALGRRRCQPLLFRLPSSVFRLLSSVFCLWLRRPNLRHPVQRDEERVPDAALAGQRRAPGARELVVAAPALPGALDPAAFDQAAVLQPVQRGIQRGHVEADRAVRSLRDQLADLVAVTPALFEQRQDEQLRAPAIQLPFEGVGGHIWPQTIWPL